MKSAEKVTISAAIIGSGFFPFPAHAGEELVRRFSGIWSDPVWSLSAVSLFLLWFVLFLLHFEEHEQEENSDGEEADEYDTYTVKRGDSLMRIAKRFHTTTEELIAANDMQPPYKMKIGQVLRVPRQAHSPQVLDLKRQRKEEELSWMAEREEESIQKPSSSLSFFMKSFLLAGVVLAATVGGIFVWSRYETKRYQGEMEEQIALYQQTIIQKRNEVQNETQEALDEEGRDEKQEEKGNVSFEEEEKEVVQEELIITPLRVLNGSGKPGAAGSLAEKLEKEDFKVEEIGNADSFSYKETEIRFAPEHKLWADAVGSALRLQGYVPVLKEVAGTDMVTIIIGRK